MTNLLTFCQWTDILSGDEMNQGVRIPRQEFTNRALRRPQEKRKARR